MTLTVGSRLGPYEILAPLGSGGMGEVYRARDDRLQRDVAIKVLHAEAGRDPERLRRFDVEARAAAALNHPNILAVFDIGRAGDQPYVVSELLEGRTLRDLLADGPLPVRKAIDYGIQTARGLAAAHDKHIVHRDLKPENVFVTSDGRVKILDLGLAKLAAPSAIQDTATGLLTTPPATSAGIVLGTVGYMAPEQVRGQAIDHRADIFAFGAVLYELLTGSRAFSGPSQVETMNAILNADLPELAAARGAISPGLERIVRRCVEKNPEERFQSARDLAFALEALTGSNVSVQGTAAAPRRRPARWMTALAALGAVAAAAIAGRLTAPAAPAGNLAFESKTLEPQVVFNARFMPDGETVVFSSALQGNLPELFISRPGAVEPSPLGLRQTQLLAVSSKGELAVLTDVSFIAHRIFRGTLARMPLDGAPRPWLEDVRDADWSPDGSTLAIVREAGLKDRLEYPIGKALHESGGYLSDVRVSPDGEHVAFFDHATRWDDRGWLKVADRAGHVKTLTPEYWGAEGIAWSADGRTIMYAVGESGWDSFYPRGVTLAGTPVPSAALPGIGFFLMDVSRAGHRLVTRNDDTRSLRARLPGEAADREFAWLGSIAAVNSQLSRDGRLLMFSDESPSAGPTYAVRIRRTDGAGGVVKLGPGDAVAISPDGRRVAADTLGADRHVVIYPTGPGEAIHLPRGPLESVVARTWLPDSEHIVVCGRERAHAFRCYEQDLAGGLPKPLTPENFSVDTVSPDGRTFTLTAEDLSKHLFTAGDSAPRPLPGTTTSDGVVGWSSDGRSVFVQRRPADTVRLERVEIATGRRTLVRETLLPDRTGLMRLLITSVIADGEGFTYSYWKRETRLFVAKAQPN